MWPISRPTGFLKTPQSCFHAAACSGFLCLAITPGQSCCLALLQGHGLVTSRAQTAEKPLGPQLCLPVVEISHLHSLEMWRLVWTLQLNQSDCAVFEGAPEACFINQSTFLHTCWPSSCRKACTDIRLPWRHVDVRQSSSTLSWSPLISPTPQARPPLKQILRQSRHLHQTRSNLETILAG